jgi:hypothetical protein
LINITSDVGGYKNNDLGRQRGLAAFYGCPQVKAVLGGIGESARMFYDEMQATVNRAAQLVPEPPAPGNAEGYARWAALTLDIGRRRCASSAGRRWPTRRSGWTR